MRLVQICRAHIYRIAIRTLIDSHRLSNKLPALTLRLRATMARSWVNFRRSARALRQWSTKSPQYGLSFHLEARWIEDTRYIRSNEMSVRVEVKGDIRNKQG